jgi:hypothetical protein
VVPLCQKEWKCVESDNFNELSPQTLTRFLRKGNSGWKDGRKLLIRS